MIRRPNRLARNAVASRKQVVSKNNSSHSKPLLLWLHHCQQQREVTFLAQVYLGILVIYTMSVLDNSEMHYLSASACDSCDYTIKYRLINEIVQNSFSGACT